MFFSIVGHLPSQGKKNRLKCPSLCHTTITHKVIFSKEVKSMEATVNENCIGCGLCASICPHVFQMGDDGLAHAGALDPKSLAAAQEARDACPVSAIDVSL